MRNLFSDRQNKSFSETFISHEVERKVNLALLTHVYQLTNIAMLASMFCSTIILVGLYVVHGDNASLWIWFVFLNTVTLLRLGLVYLFRHDKNSQARVNMWTLLCVIGAALGGLGWGLSGILLIPTISDIQITLLVLMIAGVTAGAVQLSSAVPAAANLFLLCCLVPVIVCIAMLNKPIYLLFDMSLTLYLAYSMILARKGYRLIQNSCVLKFENDALLDHLIETKDQLEISNEKLQDAASHDPLTHVNNRRLFERQLREALVRANKDNKTLALLYFDFDNFKEMNDHYGHQVGDGILVECINRVINYLGTDSVIARQGGDEFTILLEDIKSRSEVEDIARHICQIISKPVKVHDVELTQTVSIGISMYPADAREAETLVKSADKTMYFIKDRGGDNFCFNDQVLRTPLK